MVFAPQRGQTGWDFQPGNHSLLGGKSPNYVNGLAVDAASLKSGLQFVRFDAPIHDLMRDGLAVGTFRKRPL